MRGAWIRNLLLLTLQGNIPIRDALIFSSARVRSKPVSFHFCDLWFENVDHTFWGILADVYLNHVDLPANFFIHPNDIVVDVGAHRGGFASFAARCTANKILAFEPDPLNFMLLQKHIEQNHLQNITACQAAIGTKSGESTLFVSNSSSRHSLYSDLMPGHHFIDQIRVDMISLD